MPRVLSSDLILECVSGGVIIHDAAILGETIHRWRPRAQILAGSPVAEFARNPASTCQGRAAAYPSGEGVWRWISYPLSIQLASLTADMFHFQLQLPQACLFGGPRLRRQRAGKRNESQRTANISRVAKTKC